MPLKAFTQACLDAKDDASLLLALQTYVVKYRADMISYHLLVENLRHLSLHDGYIFHDVASAWAKTYMEKDYFADDPIMAACLKSREPFHWFDVGSIISLSPRQQDYMRDLRAFGAKDGFGVPIHAGLGTASFFGIGSTQRDMPLDTDERFELMSACHQIHNRWMELRGDQKGGPNLSKRETEVLTLVAQGKTNSSIAHALGVSEHTIDTLLRRSFVKLDVTDRISAALKAVGTGKVQI